MPRLYATLWPYNDHTLTHTHAVVEIIDKLGSGLLIRSFTANEIRRLSLRLVCRSAIITARVRPPRALGGHDDLPRTRLQVLGSGFWTLHHCINLRSLPPGGGGLAWGAADDTADLRALVEKFFALYAKKDLEGFMALWSEGSPEFTTRVWRMRRLFATEDAVFENITVNSVKAAAAVSGTLPVLADRTAIAIQTKQAQKRQMSYVFVCVKEDGAWKVSRWISAEDEFAAALMTAKTDEARRSLLTARKPPATNDLVQSLLAQGDLLHREGNYEPALFAYEVARTTATQIAYQSGIANSLWGTGTVHYLQGNYTQALEFMRAGYKYGVEAGDNVAIAWTLQDAGIVYALLGDYKTALEFYQRSLKVKEELRDQGDIAITLANIGELHRDQGNYELALQFLKRTLGMYEGLRYKLGIAISLNNIGEVYRLQLDYAKALETFRESLSFAEAAGDARLLAYVLGNIGLVELLQGRNDRALEVMEKALGLLEATGDKFLIAERLSDLGQVQARRGDFAKALNRYQKSLQLAETIGAPIGIFRANAGMGDVYRTQGRRADAISAYRKAIAALESMRLAGGEDERLRYLQSEGKDDVYHSLVAMVTAEGNLGEALSILERARSKQLLDGLRLRSLTVRDDNLRALLQRTEELELALAAQEKSRLTEASRTDERQDQTKVANLTRLVANTREELRSVINSIKAANPDYERFVTVKAADLSVIQRALPPNVVVVEYVPLETALLILLVTKDGTHARSVAVSRARIEELVATFHKQMERGQRTFTPHPSPNGRGVRGEGWDWNSSQAKTLRETLTTLYGYLIAPIQNDLAKADTVVVVPSGVLYYLPFQALARETPSPNPSPRGGGAQKTNSPSPLVGEGRGGGLRFFTEEKRVAVLTSLQLWDQITHHEQADGKLNRTERLSAFGNADGTLPAAEQEVQRLGALYPQSLVFTGAEATREHLMNLPASVTMNHLATHGNLSHRDVNECYLTLANGDRFKLGEIYGLAGRYPAKLTVLSACETALGGQHPGNEVSSLADGFVEAGSTTIIASLWKVNDESTATLMEHFYKGLKAGKTKAEAKRLAEIALLKNPKTAHPYYWAPFVLIGDWR